MHSRLRRGPRRTTFRHGTLVGPPYGRCRLSGEYRWFHFDTCSSAMLGMWREPRTETFKRLNTCA